MFILGHLGLTAGLLIFILIIIKKFDIIYSIDFRLVFILAMLADIIDKIIGHILFSNTLNNGRLFSHTLVFLIIFIALIYLKTRTSWWIYSIPIILHQIFDLLFLDLETWLWPAYGWEFEVMDIDVWGNWIHELTTDPYVYISEIIGAIILIILIWNFRLYKSKNLKLFLKKGTLLKK